MEITLDLIVFTVLAVFTLASAVLAVTTKRILRAATFLLFVLFGTAGIYFQLNYSFLGAVQLLIYAGGITVLYVFSILLTSSEETRPKNCAATNSSWASWQPSQDWRSACSSPCATSSCRNTSSTVNWPSGRSDSR